MNLKKSKIEMNDIVTIDYIGRRENGNIALSSKKDGILTFRVGHFTPIIGFNTAIIGMRVGESKNCVFQPGEAFGEIDTSLIYKVHVHDFSDDVVIGQKIFDGDFGSFITISDINYKTGEIVVDANHILAGQLLTFSLRVLDINPSPTGILKSKKSTSHKQKNGNRFILGLI